ncbi:hypothetical protein ECNIH5_14270 [Enterobacter cloacae]|uniref:hypothetical protein n=1 Tax=Enterobacter cloacae complex TaxID=354276 RepID=UPI0004F7B04F|nr:MULTISPECIES: hypothetical protein [Enterobacter cloacae complex]AIX59859.1 hypothetical protein ECNIH5_14270 [Enterobacter cloacae]AIN23447.1 hypothetical protein ECNIH3_14345 [Enterobacter hormaechei subsp. hoffmannii ECNIH3]AIN28785.1 hypothetical protein ECR091_14280 [Enterobacter hormaechei subsp. hoffmannii ECR091]EKS6640572.1 hypothetical protein [Enterobacter hormaechei]ELD2070320.1 hypothetical protein [Enterobacter hormaechei]
MPKQTTSQPGACTALKVISDRRDHELIRKVALLVLEHGRCRNMTDQALAMETILNTLRPGWSREDFRETLNSLHTHVINDKLFITKQS